jgi:uncharacterized membrane protein
MNEAAIGTLPNLNEAQNEVQNASPPVHVNAITLKQPWEWLIEGWADLRRAPRFSLTYGAVFVLVSLLMTLGLLADGLFFIIPVLAAGFFLVAPMLGIGLYQISANLEAGRPVHFCQALEAWRRNEVQLGAMALVLLFVMLTWMLAAILVFALFYTSPVPTWEDFIPRVFLSGENNAFVLAGILVGAVIAGFTFAISAVTVPLLMDRPEVDVMTAMRTSVAAVRRNRQAMTLWAALIVLFVGLGILTWFIGLVIAMPLIGHGTWHAYRDLVGGKDEG